MGRMRQQQGWRERIRDQNAIAQPQDAIFPAPQQEHDILVRVEVLNGINAYITTTAATRENRMQPSHVRITN